MIERTLAIIKPDSLKAGNIGAILSRIEETGFQIRAMRMVKLTKKEAEGFYAVHAGKPFFNGLTDFMSSGPAIVLVLEAEDAIRKWRDLMGATDPAKAAPGSLRALYGKEISFNAVHGSDAPDTASFEISYFFRGMELIE